MGALSEVEKNQTLLKSNADQVVKEIDEINRRLTLALKERTDYLKSAVEKYVSNEMKSLKDLKDGPQDYLDLRAITDSSVSSGAMRKVLLHGAELSENRDTTGTPTRAGPTSTGTAAMKRMRNPLEGQDTDL